MRITIDPSNISDYAKFLKIKGLPSFHCVGRELSFPDEYAHLLNETPTAEAASKKYVPIKRLFDYQRDISRMAIEKRKFAVFVDPGFGKTLIGLEFVRHVAAVLPKGKRLLWLSPLMVVKQTMVEAKEWYGDKLPIVQIPAANLQAWLNGEGDGRIGISNYDALTDDLKQGVLGAIVCDESSILKNAYGKWGQTILRIGDGLAWKLCLTGTPAPNDRIEYATHAVFLDAFPTVNAFLARFFVNRGQTQERWVLKPHAIEPFYRALSHWSIFMSNPATYGWKDNVDTIPPIHTHIHHVEMTQGQRDATFAATGELFVINAGGITKRAKLSQIGKGKGGVGSLKPAFIKGLVDSWPDEQTIIWCLYDEEQDGLATLFPTGGSIAGKTPYPVRETIIDLFKARQCTPLLTKTKCLGYGLNLQVCTRMIFSGLQDSYESYVQAIKRANRVRSTLPLNVHIPVTENEVPMIESVLAKANRVQQDTDEQERIFKQFAKGMS